MTSSLASQLYQMRNVDRIISTERAQKIKASFLFDGRQAADMDNQTIFDIGRDGLEELRKINHKFDVYADTLFSEAVKDLDRVLQTKEENKRLDESIRSFLFQLAPHFLTKPAGKAIEWLVRRFRIQEFNARDILAAIFPYHETKAFLTLLTIITFDTQDMGIFGFLVTQRKARRLLDRATLMAQCVRDRSLMAFMCNSVFKAIASGFGYPGLHSFYVMVMTQYIGQLQIIDDSTIQFVLPYVLDGLNYESKDAQIAAYMVIGSLATRVTFTQDALEKTLCAVAKHPIDIQTMSMCLIQLLQSQMSTADLSVSSRCFKLLAKHELFPRALCDIAKSFDIELVMRVFLSALVRSANSEEKLLDFLSTFVPIIPASSTTVLCDCVIRESISATLNSESMDPLLQVLDLIRLRYSQQLEDVIGAAASSIGERSELDKAQKEAVHKMLYHVKLRGSAHGASGLLPLKETSTTLYLSINHADSGIRLVAAKALRDIVTGKNTEFSLTAEDISSLVFERLQYEDDERVLDVVLSLPIADYVSPESLVPALVDIIESQRVSIARLCDKIIDNLLAVDCSDKKVYDQVASAILPYMIFFSATDAVSASVFSRLGSSNFGKQSSGWLACIASLGASSESVTGRNLNKLVPARLAKELVENWDDSANSGTAIWNSQLLPSASMQSRIVALSIGAHVVSLLAQSKHTSRYVDALSAIISTALHILSLCSITSGSSFADSASIDTISDAKWEKLLVGLSEPQDLDSAAARIAVGTFSSAVAVLPSTLKLDANMWFGSAVATKDSKSRYHELVRTTFVSIISRSSGLRSIEGIIIGRLLGVCAGSEWAAFLASIWLSDTSSLVRSRCLLTFKALVHHKASSNEAATNIDYQTVLPSIIAMMSDVDPRVRSAAAGCVKSLKSLHPVFFDKKQKHHISKHKASTQQDIYQYDEFYGQTSNKLQYLPLDTESRFVHLLSTCADEISSDSLAIQAELGFILNKGITSSRIESDSKDGGTYLKLNSQGRESIVVYLLSHVAATDGVVPALQTRLLGVLESVVSACFIEQLPSLISGHIKQLESAAALPQRDDVEDMLIRKLFALCYSPSTAVHLVAENGSKYWNEFLGFAAGVTQHLGSRTSDWSRREFTQAYIQQIAFERLASKLASALSAQTISSLTACLFGVASRGNSYFVPELSSVSLRQLFSAIPLDPNVAADEINAIAEKLAVDDSDSARLAKRHRSARAPDTSSLVLPELATLLEYVQCSPQLSTEPLLVPSLFALLSVFVSDLSPSSSAGAPRLSSADLASSKQVSLEYIMQLVLTMLTRIVDEANRAGTSIAESVIRVDVIIQAIRTSTSPQTHNQTLLLLAGVATQHPDIVLHHVMAIFTFMGANVMRQDDEYSFHVIQQTLEKVIPPLVRSDPANIQTAAARVAQAGPVLRVFVDTLSHIPRHRRMALFTTLVRTMGADAYAPAVLSLLLERNVARILKSSGNKAEGPTKETEDIVAFALSLTHSLSALQQIGSVETLVQHINIMPTECAVQGEDAAKDGNAVAIETAASELYIDVANMNNKQLRTYRLVALDFVHRLLTSRQFVDKLNGVQDAPETNAKLSSSTEELLKVIATLGGQYERLSALGHLETSVAERAWKQSIQIAYNALDDVNSIMGQSMFVKTVTQLLSHRDLKVRRKVMALANTKLREFDIKRTGKDSPVIDSVLEMIMPIASIGEQKAGLDLSTNDTREFLACKQTALLCIATASKKFAAARPNIFVSIVKMISCEDSLGSSNPAIASAALVALSVLCSELGSRLIPSLPQYLPLALKHLHAVVSKYRSADADDLALMISALSAMQAIVENMSAFLAPSLPPLFACLFSPSLRVPANNDDDKDMEDDSNSSSDDAGNSSDSSSTDAPSAVKGSGKSGAGNGSLIQLREQADKLVDDVLLALAKNIPARQLIPAQFSFYQKEASKMGTAIIVPFVDFVGKTGGLLRSNYLMQFYKPLFKFFLSVFDLARSPAIPLGDVELIEEATLDAFMRFVVKLNENLFKPLFLSFVDWATTEPSALPPPQHHGGWISASSSPVAKSRYGKKDDKRARQQSASEARLRVFYRVLNVLFDKLKSILTPYYSSVIDTTVALLDRFGIVHDTIEAQEEEDRMEKPVPSALWCAVVESIHQSALHDTNGFWGDAMFKKVLRPLANQLPNTKAPQGAISGEQEYDQYITRVRRYLAPAASQLSAAVGDDAMWKQLNQAVMLRSRSDEPAVRVGSLLILQSLYERLGEEYLILLPETIPYLAELLEDDDPRVERATQETIKVIESYLGESLQSYLR
ncbi:snoRNA-binding rRNA-processing protein utp10 [Coemansia sp. RSA 1646]|nr:snoRNA-binding rRNA-processing protein utp10 [Coemansia sp. RSA 1646]